MVLYVIAVISNPRGFKRRYELYRNFKTHIESFKGVELWTVELSFGNRPFEVTKKRFWNNRNIQLRSNSELWHKENLINIGVSHLPKDWKNVCFIDADITFCNKNWVKDTERALEHFSVIQMFQSCADLNYEGGVMQTHTSFGYCYQKGLMDKKSGQSQQYVFPHPGYAWAMTRKAWEISGGLIDFAILGSADHAQAYAWIGQVEKSIPAGLNETYINMLKLYQERCKKLNKNIGYIPCTILHHWHGNKASRRYKERWQILLEFAYNPMLDITRNKNGLIEFVGNKKAMEQEISKYFIQRNEDSIS